jgi:hypothetical protein
MRWRSSRISSIGRPIGLPNTTAFSSSSRRLNVSVHARTQQRPRAPPAHTRYAPPPGTAARAGSSVAQEIADVARHLVVLRADACAVVFYVCARNCDLRPGNADLAGVYGGHGAGQVGLALLGEVRLQVSGNKVNSRKLRSVFEAHVKGDALGVPPLALACAAHAKVGAARGAYLV